MVGARPWHGDPVQRPVNLRHLVPTPRPDSHYHGRDYDRGGDRHQRRRWECHDPPGLDPPRVQLTRTSQPKEGGADGADVHSMTIMELSDFLQLKIEREAEKKQEALKKAKRDMEETGAAAASAKMRYERGACEWRAGAGRACPRSGTHSRACHCPYACDPRRQCQGVGIGD
eukprot:9488445-Pyramimonas_sp.AAC.1